MQDISRRKLIVAGGLAALGACVAPAALAQAIEDIKKKGALRVGVLSDLPPMGSIDRQGKPVGYDVDVAELLGARLGLPVTFTGTTSASRVALLMTGKVDLLIATVGMYPERAKVVQFSKPYATFSINVVGKKGDPVATMADLAGRTVGVARSSAMDAEITKAAPKTTNIMRFDDEATSMQALLSGQVELLGAQTMMLRNIKNTDKGDLYEQKFVIVRQYMGIAMRPRQKALNAYVNDFIDEIKANGKLNAISRKWLGEDIPEFPASMDGVPFTV
jgi:polar amino acid transport system substrate-binding protein